MYYLFRFAAIIVPWLPRGCIEALSKVIGLLVWLIASRARKQATANMLHVLGRQVLATRTGRRRLRQTVQGMFQNNVHNYLDLFSLPDVQAETILHNAHIEGLEHVDAALAPGKGLILFA